MGNCGSDTNRPPAGSAPQARGGGGPEVDHSIIATGFGAPLVSKGRPSDQPTLRADVRYFNSLPPCPVANEVVRLHKKPEGAGNPILINLYNSVRAVRLYGKDKRAARFVSLSLLNKEPDAIRIAKHAGFETDLNNVERLSAETTDGRFAHRRSSWELDILLQYIEAVLGGIPPASGTLNDEHRTELRAGESGRQAPAAESPIAELDASAEIAA